MLLGTGCSRSEISKTTQPEKIDQVNKNNQELIQIEEQLANAFAQSSGIHPDTYKQIEDQLRNLDSKGINTADARALLAKFEIGGVKQDIAPVLSDIQETDNKPKVLTTITPIKTPKNPSLVNPESSKPKSITKSDSQDSGSTKPTQSSGCVSNPNPVFTKHVTDPNLIKYVVPPPTMGGSGTSLKTHSYIGTNFAKAPVYAPVDMVLDTGAHYTSGPYWLGFVVSCEVKLRFIHIAEPIQAIKDVFPSTPQEGSVDMPIKNAVAFKAGDLIGYAESGNWDFGVYNSTKPNRYVNDPMWGNSWVYTTGDCPFNYYSAEMKSIYINKFDSKILGGNPPHGESFCKEALDNS